MKKIKISKPDIVSKDYKRKTCILIEYKEYNKISKYTDLEIEIEKIRHLKTTTV